jgi:F-type H+-transporting ATPase subunit b
MKFDWFTIIAQIVNFTILIFLLHRLLFKRVTRAMDKRREKISSEQKEAAQKLDQAKELKQKYYDKLNEFEQLKQKNLEQAEQEAEERKKEILDQAKEKIEKKKKEWQKQLESEEKAIIENLFEKSARLAFAASEKALGEIADADMEDKSIEKFIEKIEQSDIDTQAENAAIESAHKIDDDGRKKIEDALQDVFNKRIDVEYSVDKSLISGIRIIAGDKKISWNIRDYLAGMQSEINEILESNK